ncbi:DUF4142 domain-containing protein [Chryseobacterium caseinilyticum]|uniref:DUF4142 domain-containing protein n=1 Tax=Chryseobacterium caseinilyticum TaxID=2771428 RepID=A0ABR8Z8A0_9FLAO|nr:DUF4142 domain-containing protein [Chryseobacterium caseinilyticum]MBD8081499.1 DUF4142 domain-containing protein [Chryseobacterium caseinilyticum]
MKNSILTVFAVAALMSCDKKETKSTDMGTDSSGTEMTNDTMMKTGDSASTVTNANAATLSDQDKKFADAAAMGGMMEVMMGDLAKANGTNASVKSLGEMMATDHGKANDELKSWAATAGYTLPTSLDAEKQKMVDDLKTKKGADFDKMYAAAMVTDHKKDIAEFKMQSSSGMDASLKGFASKTLPTLEHHLMESEKVKASLK